MEGKDRKKIQRFDISKPAVETSGVLLEDMQAFLDFVNDDQAQAVFHILTPMYPGGIRTMCQ